MKISNYEISKKLAEIGFKAKSDSLIHHPEKIFAEKYWAYDLETLIDALPVFIQQDGIEYFQFFSNSGLGFYPPYDKYSGQSVFDMEDGIFEYIKELDESLANTAGRLLIKLHEAGIINFRK